MANRGFENFDFGSNAEWKSYYENIYPPPDYSKLTRIKQRWYKSHIDPNYNPNPSASPSSSSQQSSRSQDQSFTPASLMQKIQAALLILSIPGMLYGKSLHLIFCAHLAGIIHYHNMPKLNIEYWRPVIGDDNLHSLAFALLFLILPSTFLWTVPAYLGALVYLPDIALRLPGLPSSLRNYANRLNNKKLELLQARADCETWIGFGVAILVVAGYTNWITPLIYWQYLRMRYMLNSFSKISFANLRVKGDALFIGKAGVGIVWEKIKSLCNWLSSVNTN